MLSSFLVPLALMGSSVSVDLSAPVCSAANAVTPLSMEIKGEAITYPGCTIINNLGFNLCIWDCDGTWWIGDCTED